MDESQNVTLDLGLHKISMYHRVGSAPGQCMGVNRLSLACR